jgi:heavy metal sensor kinase
MNRWNIRVRLTLLFLAVESVFLVVFIASVYGLFTHRLTDAVDLNLRDKLETLGAAYELSGEYVQVELDEHSRDTLWADSIAQILTPDGRVLFQNRPGGAVPLPVSLIAPSQPEDGAVHLTSADVAGAGEMRIGRQVDKREGRPVVVAIAVPLKAMRQQQRALLSVMLMAGIVLLAVSVALGWFVVGRLLRPLGDMARKARQITAERLHDRLEVANPHDEIGQLATTLNGMMERLHASFDQMRRFTSDASHELRTPLTCMRNELEVALTQSRSPDEYRDVLGSTLEEIDRLTRLSDALLTLARLDSGRMTLQNEDVDLNELLVEAADRIRVQADAKGAELYVDAGSTPCRVKGDHRLIEQAFLNLMDNAIKYGGTGIHVRLSMEDGAVVVTVHDSGTGIPTEHLEHLFERFYRVDKSRSRELGGAGLGLSLAKQYVELHGGSISVSSDAGNGTTFTVRFLAIKDSG